MQVGQALPPHVGPAGREPSPHASDQDPRGAYRISRATPTAAAKIAPCRQLPVWCAASATVLPASSSERQDRPAISRGSARTRRDGAARPGVTSGAPRAVGAGQRPAPPRVPFRCPRPAALQERLGVTSTGRRPREQAGQEPLQPDAQAVRRQRFPPAPSLPLPTDRWRRCCRPLRPGSEVPRPTASAGGRRPRWRWLRRSRRAAERSGRPVRDSR